MTVKAFLHVVKNFLDQTRQNGIKILQIPDIN